MNSNLSIHCNRATLLIMTGPVTATAHQLPSGEWENEAKKRRQKREGKGVWQQLPINCRHSPTWQAHDVGSPSALITAQHNSPVEAPKLTPSYGTKPRNSAMIRNTSCRRRTPECGVGGISSQSEDRVLISATSQTATTVDSGHGAPPSEQPPKRRWQRQSSPFKSALQS